jgi:maltooligosyltrehalose trehalohydrolase
LRREDPVFRTGGGNVDGAVIGPEALVLRFCGTGAGEDDRLLCINLGRDLVLPSIGEPLLAPARGARWSLLWSSEAVRYGGGGTPEADTDRGWRLPGHAALVLRSSRR